MGYYRFDTQAEYEALTEVVYKHLCPLLNFYYYPSVKIIQKLRVGSQVKKKYDQPKPPYQRLMHSADVQQQVKTQLRRSAKRFPIVKQKRFVDQAVARLMRIHEDKDQERLPLE